MFRLLPSHGDAIRAEFIETRVVVQIKSDHPVVGTQGILDLLWHLYALQGGVCPYCGEDTLGSKFRFVHEGVAWHTLCLADSTDSMPGY